MKKVFLAFVASFLSFFTYSQSQNLLDSNRSPERFPVFPLCEKLDNQELENCFYNEVQDFVFQSFVVPENLVENNKNEDDDGDMNMMVI